MTKELPPPQANAVLYSVVEIPTGRTLERGMNREEADGCAFGFNGSAKADGSFARAAVVQAEDAPPPAKRHLVYLFRDGVIEAQVRTTEAFAAEFNRLMPLGFQAEIVRVPRQGKPSKSTKRLMIDIYAQY